MWTHATVEACKDFSEASHFMSPVAHPKVFWSKIEMKSDEQSYGLGTQVQNNHFAKQE